MGKNPSNCFRGIDLDTGAKRRSMSCKCADGLASNGVVECVPPQCPRTVNSVVSGVPMETVCMGNVTRSAECTVMCPAGTAGPALQFVCGAGGAWEAPGPLECLSVFDSAPVATVIGLAITFPAPAATTKLTFDPGREWADASPHYGREHYSRTGGDSATYAIHRRCLLEPSEANGTCYIYPQIVY